MAGITNQWEAGATEGVSIAHLTYNLYHAVVLFYLFPDVKAFATRTDISTNQYPYLKTAIIPTPGPRYLTTEIVLYMLLTMSWRVVLPHQPGELLLETVTLTMHSQGQPPLPRSIGSLYLDLGQKPNASETIAPLKENQRKNK